MYCRFCKNDAENVHVVTERFYCNKECVDLHATYKDWKTTYAKQEAYPVYRESFHDIIMRTGGYPVHTAHRGGGFSFAPENTLYAFKKSVEHGARLLELDLRLTKDNHLVILHWGTVDETTDGTGSVTSYTLKQLKQLDAAFHNPELRGTGITIPTLKEFLDTFVPIPDLLFFFDFKDTLSLKMSLKMIDGYGIGNRFALGSVITSTNAYIINYRERYPDVPNCTDIINTFKMTLDYYLGLLNLHTFEHTMYGFVLCKATLPFWGKGLVDAMHNHGCRVTVSGFGEELNKPERLRECIEYGVDFIMTDRPDILQGLLFRDK